MIPLLASVVLASFAGSAHCAAMCGGLGLVASQGGRPLLQTIYHAARLSMYVLLGAVAGLFGHGIDTVGALFDLERAAAIVMGLTLVVTLALQLGTSGRLGALVGQCVRKILPPNLAPWSRAGALGVATALIPCGWLYAFVAAAAATGAPLTGASVMAAFWLGSVPALVGTASVPRLLSRTWLAKYPKVTIALIAVACIASVVTRSTGLVHLHARLDTSTPALVCHGDTP